MSAPRPDGPHVDLAELADLDAGLLDETRAQEVRTAAQSDPAARAFLDALAATRAELAAVDDPPVPAAMAERFRAALRAEQSRLAVTSGPALVPQAGPAGGDRPRDATRPLARGRALLRRPAVLAAVLLVAVLVGGGLLNTRQEQLPLVERPQLVAQGLSTIGVRDTGGLADLARRTACLQAVAPGVAAAAPLLGGRRVVFEGNQGVLLVLGTGKRGVFDVVIVDPACGPGGGTLLAATHVAPP